MSGSLFLLIAFAFAGLVFVNIYIRVKVLRLYRKLVKNEVQFETSDLLNIERMETEIVPKYPEDANTIRQFVRHIKYSIRIAICIIILISIFGGLLMYYR